MALDFFVCDHEKCLRTEMSLLAVQKANLNVVDFPKRSQDFNAMENAWFIIRQRLDETQPRNLEHRDELVKQMEEIILENLVLEIHLDNKIMTVLFGYHGDSFRKKCKDVKVAVYKSINNVVCFQGSLKNVSYVFYTFCCWS